MSIPEQAFIEEFIAAQKNLNVIPIEMEFTTFYVPLSNPNNKKGTLELVSMEDAIKSLENNEHYPKVVTQIPFDRDLLYSIFIVYNEKLYNISLDALDINEKKINDFNRMIKLLSTADLLKKQKVWYAFICIEDGRRLIYKLSKSIPQFVTVFDLADYNLTNLAGYQLNNMRTMTFDLFDGVIYSQNAKNGPIKQIERVVITDFEKIQKDTLLVRSEDDAQIILPEKEIAIDKKLLHKLSENPRAFVKDFKYIRNYLSEDDLELFDTETMDADDFVDTLFDVAKKKEFLKAPAQIALQKQLGEMIYYV